ncbi:hypothetical protein [Kitasatospora azatica]|uniref:hypothetical protein n=1 Tax=Kitasatospora azatica TaxID=58347 RepID=UPI0007C649F1|nr:hypothetical protein [Kitasatospora azatica]
MATAYPTAAPGFGKRSAPSQHPAGPTDFAHLPEREAYLAAYIDRLPDGAAIDTKTLAREQPRYGQQAVRSALRVLTRAGHLLRVRETVGEGLTRWVFRTFFSRTARPVSWWERFLADRRGGATREDPTPAPPPRSEAYRALASLGATDRRMTLSAKECAELEALAAEWLARDITVQQFRHAMTSGLPAAIHCPGAFTRRRLVDRIPPHPNRDPRPQDRTECANCRAPGSAETQPGGLCPRCVGTEAATAPTAPRGGLIAQARAVVRQARARGVSGADQPRTAGEPAC